jgi:AraC-like DNA-binding protein
MSIEAVSLVLNNSRATGRAKLVLLGIANHLGDHGAWPSISTLARYANASERSVKRDIQELVELGELKVELQNAPTKTQYKTNLYWITISSGVTDSASGVTDWVSRGDSSGKSGVTPVGTQNINITIKEPSLKSDLESFETFWLLYPKKVAKADAIKAWKQATKKKTADELIGLVKAYSESKLPDQQYIPYPASWLNKELYDTVQVEQPKTFPTPIYGRIK